jgi:hypothetical protein
MSRQIFEQRFPVPADAMWSDSLMAYVWVNYQQTSHPHDDLWAVWQEAWASQQVPNDVVQALENELATIQTTLGSYANPKQAIAALIDWHVQVATDPKTNGGRVLVPTEKASQPQVPEGYVLLPIAEIKKVAARMGMIRAGSQFCECSSFEIANSWMCETHGGDMLTASQVQEL